MRGYFDPPLWRTELDTWARQYGDTVIGRFETARARMLGAVERFRTDVAAGRLRHTGDRTLTQHVLNVRTKQHRGGGYWLEKDRPGSGHKIDAAVAAVLAYEARADTLAGTQDTRSRVPMSWRARPRIPPMSSSSSATPRFATSSASAPSWRGPALRVASALEDGGEVALIVPVPDTPELAPWALVLEVGAELAECIAEALELTVSDYRDRRALEQEWAP